MTDSHRHNGPAMEAKRDAAKSSLAAGALLAAFGVASCCALPMALAMFGAGSAALVGIGVLVGPYQVEVLAAAVACLFGTALIMLRQRRARACSSTGTCVRPLMDRFSKVAIVFSLALLALTFWLEPPL